MLNWHFLLATLVFANLILCCSQDDSNFCLGLIVVDSQIPNFLCILLHTRTPQL